MPSSFCPSCLAERSQAQQSCDCGQPRPASGWPNDPWLGRLINGKYRITERLAQGGFGTLLLATQHSAGQELGRVVIKFLHGGRAADADVRRRFVNEARAAREVDHPNVVKVFDFDFDEHGEPFIVMEYLSGQPLTERLKSGPLSAQLTRDIGLQIADALAACHEAGVLHRDLKPANVLMQSTAVAETIKLIDFGLAQLPEASLSEQMFGTPRYMAPEQIRGEPLDQRVDVFALGVLLFECLTGEPPILASGPSQYLTENLTTPARRLRAIRTDLPEVLDGLLARMMEKDRELRPRTMREVAARLRSLDLSARRASDGPQTLELGVPPVAPIVSLPRVPWLVFGLLMLLAIGALLFYRSAQYHASLDIDSGVLSAADLSPPRPPVARPTSIDDAALPLRRDLAQGAGRQDRALDAGVAVQPAAQSNQHDARRPDKPQRVRRSPANEGYGKPQGGL